MFFIIPGIAISIATFPGVIVHEAAHMLFCKLRGVAVFDVCFFQFENPCGYVVHERTEDFNTTFLICVGPFIVNSLLCIFICLPAVLPFKVFDVLNFPSMFLLWLGISIGMHAFPSSGDAKSLQSQATKARADHNILAIISYPIVVLINIANVLTIVWFDLFYSAAIGLGLPALFL